MTRNKNNIADALFQTWRISYENGEPKPPSKQELHMMTAEKAHETVAEFFRYVFDYFKIEPLELAACWSEKRLTDLKLNNIFRDFLIFPTEYASKRYGYVNKIDYLSRLLYPEKFMGSYECSEDYTWMLEYLKCEQRKAEGSKYNFILTGNSTHDRKKISYLLHYYIQTHPIPGIDNDMKKMYDFFASPKAQHYISSSLLHKPVKILFESPLEAFHYTCPDINRSEFMYNYELFKLAEQNSWK